MYGRMLLNKYSWRCTDRPVGGTVGGILLFNKLSEITNSVQTDEEDDLNSLTLSLTSFENTNL